MSLRRLPLVLLLLTLVLDLTGCGKADKKTTAALVNGTAITRAELAAELERVAQRFYTAAPPTDQQKAQLEKEILDIMIGGELLYQASRKEGITVADDEVKAELAKSKEAFPDTDKFKNTFSEQDIRKKIAIERFIARKFADPTVITDEQCRKYYDDNQPDFTKPEQVLVSQILIKAGTEAPKEDQDKALAKLKGLQKELDKGADFGELAKKHSEDQSASNGGMMGFLLRGQAEKPIEEAAFGMAHGKTAIVQTRSGSHLLKATDHRPAEVIPYQEVAEKLNRFLKQQEVQRKIEAFLKESRDQAKIEILPAS